MNHIVTNIALFICISSISFLSSAKGIGAGNSYDFSSAHLLVPQNASQNSTTLTIEAWIKAD